MPWLLMSPGHQQPWYWLCRICMSWSYLRKDFKYLCHINVELCTYMFIFPLKNLAQGCKYNQNRAKGYKIMCIYNGLHLTLSSDAHINEKWKKGDIYHTYTPIHYCDITWTVCISITGNLTVYSVAFADDKTQKISKLCFYLPFMRGICSYWYSSRPRSHGKGLCVLTSPCEYRVKTTRYL